MMTLKDLAANSLPFKRPATDIQTAVGPKPRSASYTGGFGQGSVESLEHNEFLSERGPTAPANRFKVTRIDIDVDETENVKPPVSFFDDPKGLDEKKRRKTEAYGSAVEKPFLNLYEDDIAGTAEAVHTGVHRTIVAQDGGKRAVLGTFFGVFLPCCQNIVGVIYFVRLPWIVGCGGILESLLIVTICNLMSFTTAISMSAIATNGRVTAGGTYFMISRSLGPAVGGSVGLFFFMGTSISVAMYYLGTIEILLKYIAPGMAVFSTSKYDTSGLYWDYRLYGTILLLCMAIVVFIGVQCVSRFAFMAIIFLVCALISVFTGLFVYTADNSYSEKICVLGDRVMRHANVFMNDSMMCDKREGGPLFEAYCDSYVNGSFMCDDYFTKHEPELIPAIPGFSIELFLEQFNNFYTEEGHIPGTNVEAKKSRDIFTDITTSFVFLISIYFPSITGVESGSNYSGDLRDAQKSIPQGTLSAVVVTSTIYISSVVLFGSCVEGVVLRDKFGESISTHGDLILSLMAFPSKYIVLAGALTATIGAGLQALAGGPRLLQAIADDQILPRLGFFAEKWRGEPIRCLMVTLVIAETGILIANLDYVAPIVTMFFLICYGFINFAVTLQSLLDTLHWRPSFKYYHWTITLLGTAFCLITMFICEWRYALLAIVLVSLVHHYIEYKGAEKEWGDGMAGLSISAAIYALNRLKREFRHTKNWRPQVLVLLKMQHAFHDGSEMFSSDDRNQVELASMLKEGKGLLMVGTIVKGKLGDMLVEKMEITQLYNACLDHAQVKAFVEVAVSENVAEGLSLMIQSAGLGALRPNTIVLGWPKEWTYNRDVHSYNVFLETMRNIALAQKACIVLKCEEVFPTRDHRLTGTIDVWWIVHDGGMLLLLAFLMRRNKTWSKCKLRVFSVAQEEDNTVQIKKDLQDYIYQLRLDATVEVVEMTATDISAYVYERTLKLEERTRMLQSIHGKNKKTSMSAIVTGKLLNKDAQAVLERARLSEWRSNFHDHSTCIDEDRHIRKSMKPSPENLRHMHTAVLLNELVRKRSSGADLIILNLPCVPESSEGQNNYMSFLEALSEGLDKLLLVRGTGSEVITIFN